MSRLPLSVEIPIEVMQGKSDIKKSAFWDYIMKAQKDFDCDVEKFILGFKK